MRTIKFRAWDKKQSIMFPVSEVKKWQVKELDKKDDNLVVMQFTGLLDKNGKEIYEGDIVQKVLPTSGNRDTKIQPFQVLWKVQWHINGWNIAQGKYYAVIGNKWENPELLNNKAASE